MLDDTLKQEKEIVYRATFEELLTNPYTKARWVQCMETYGIMSCGIPSGIFCGVSAFMLARLTPMKLYSGYIGITSAITGYMLGKPMCTAECIQASVNAKISRVEREGRNIIFCFKTPPQFGQIEMGGYKHASVKQIPEQRSIEDDLSIVDKRDSFDFNALNSSDYHSINGADEYLGSDVSDLTETETVPQKATTYDELRQKNREQYMDEQKRLRERYYQGNRTAEGRVSTQPTERTERTEPSKPVRRNKYGDTIE